MSAAGVEAIIKPLLTDNIAFKPLDRIYGTIFLDEFARDQGRGSWLDLAELAEKIRAVERASKHHLPWIKLACRAGHFALERAPWVFAHRNFRG